MKIEFPSAGIEHICRLFGLSRDAFYTAEKRMNIRYLQEVLVLDEVRNIKEDQPQLSTEKAYQMLKPFLREHGIKMARDKLYDLLRDHGLLPNRKRNGPRTTQSKHRFYPAWNVSTRTW